MANVHVRYCRRGLAILTLVDLPDLNETVALPGFHLPGHARRHAVGAFTFLP